MVKVTFKDFKEAVYRLIEDEYTEYGEQMGMGSDPGTIMKVTEDDQRLADRETVDTYFDIVNDVSLNKGFKLDIGEKVTVKLNLVIDRRYKMEGDHISEFFTSDMKKYVGKILTVKEYKAGKYILEDEESDDNDLNRWFWTDDMLGTIKYERLEKEKVMKKSDLKNGMIIKYRNCDYEYALVVDDKFIDLDSYMEFEDYNEDLIVKGSTEDFDIVAVYEVNTWSTGLQNVLKGNHLTLLWERKVEKEMTVKEISEKLGYDVKIVKEKK